MADLDRGVELRRGVTGFVGLVCAAAVAVALVRLLWNADPAAEGAAILWKLVPLAATLGTAWGVVALARYALGTPPPPAQASGPVQEAVRDRLGPRIVVIGTILIALLVVATIGAFMLAVVQQNDATLRGKTDTFLTGIFGAVLPVVATWVGTVLAFYFTRESFREAAQNTRELFDRSAQRTVAELMIPLEKLAKYGQAEVAATGTVEMARTAARQLLLKDIRERFTPPVTRVPVLDSKSRALFVVRQKLVPDAATMTAAADTRTLDEYLKQAGNEADAISFKVLAGTASVQEARSLVEGGAKEIFVTENGRDDQAVRGMLTDDDVRKFVTR